MPKKCNSVQRRVVVAPAKYGSPASTEVSNTERIIESNKKVAAHKHGGHIQNKS